MTQFFDEKKENLFFLKAREKPVEYMQNEGQASLEGSIFWTQKPEFKKGFWVSSTIISLSCFWFYYQTGDNLLIIFGIASLFLFNPKIFAHLMILKAYTSSGKTYNVRLEIQDNSIVKYLGEIEEKKVSLTERKPIFIYDNQAVIMDKSNAIALPLSIIE